MGAHQVHQLPFGINLELAMESFHVDNFAAEQALIGMPRLLPRYHNSTLYETLGISLS